MSIIIFILVPMIAVLKPSHERMFGIKAKQNKRSTKRKNVLRYLSDAQNYEDEAQHFTFLAQGHLQCFK